MNRVLKKSMGQKIALLPPEVSQQDIKSLFSSRSVEHSKIRVVFSGRVIGKARARSSSRSKHFYTPTPTSEVENLIGISGRIAMAGKPPLSLPLRVNICIFTKVPTSWPRLKREAAKQGKLLPIGKPDIDNQAKAIFDGLQKIVFYDDSQIIEKSIIRRYADFEGFIADIEEVSSHDNVSCFFNSGS